MPSFTSFKNRKKKLASSYYFKKIDKKLDALIIFKILGVLMGIVGLFFAGNWVFQSISVSRDSFEIPNSFSIESFDAEEKPLSEAYLNFKIGGTGVMYGGCANLPGCIGSSDGEYYSGVCRANNFKDRGCGWNEETSCSCNSCQTGCWGETPYFPSEVKIYCNKNLIPYNCDVNGNCKTQNFASLFPSSIPKDWSMECNVACNSRGRLNNVVLEYEHGDICIPIYDECKPWSDCEDGYQKRECYQTTTCKIEKEYIIQTKECNSGDCVEEDYGWGKVAGTCYFFDKCSEPSSSIKVYNNQEDCEKSSVNMVIIALLILLVLIIGGVIIYVKKRKKSII